MGSFKANIHNQSFLEQKYFQFSTISQILGPTVKICAANASREFCCLYFKPHPRICAECVPALRDLCRRPFEPAEGSSNHKSCFFLRLERWLALYLLSRWDSSDTSPESFTNTWGLHNQTIPSELFSCKTVTHTLMMTVGYSLTRPNTLIWCFTDLKKEERKYRQSIPTDSYNISAGITDLIILDAITVAFHMILSPSVCAEYWI